MKCDKCGFEPLSKQEIEKIINSFDGNHIIHTDYDSEPCITCITDAGVIEIADAIVSAMKK